jgi:hypothetical protein
MAYIGFKNMPKGMSPRLRAWIGRRKYGKDKYQRYAAKGKTMEKAKPVHHAQSAGEQRESLEKKKAA